MQESWVTEKGGINTCEVDVLYVLCDGTTNRLFMASRVCCLVIRAAKSIEGREWIKFSSLARKDALVELSKRTSLRPTTNSVCCS